jgi:hypothetical protein
MKKILKIALLFFTSQSFAQKAVLIEEKGVIRSSQKKESYSSSITMREQKRVGISAGFGGAFGLFGINLELNYGATNSALIGFGGGPRYSSVEFGWKHVWGGALFSGYSRLSMSRWATRNSDDRPLASTSPNILGDRFLTEKELLSGQFDLLMNYAAIGLNYNLLSGTAVGTSFYLELGLLTLLDGLKTSPVAGLGSIYYF